MATLEQARALIGNLARGQHLEVAAKRAHVPLPEARRIAAEHGHPDLGKLEQAARRLDAHQPVASADRLDQLLAEADELGVSTTRIVTAKGRLAQAVTALESSIKIARERAAASVARLEKERAAAALLAELAEHEQRADEIRQKLRADRGGPGRQPDARKIRAWARAQGIDVPKMGCVPAAVVDQWRAAGAP